MALFATLDLVWLVFNEVVVALQLITLTWTVAIPWPSSVLNVLEEFAAVFRLAFTADAYIPLFLVASIAVVLFTLFTLVFSLCELDCCEGSFWDEYIWFWFGETVIFGFLFIPFLGLVLEIFNCRDIGLESTVLFRHPSTECWSAEHIVMFVLGLLALIGLIAGGIIRSSIHNKVIHDREKITCHRQSVLFFDSALLIYRLIVVAISIFVLNNPVALSLMLFLLSIVPMTATLVYAPYVNPKLNYLKACLYGALVWASFCALITAAVDVDDQDNLAGSYLLIGILVAVPLAFVVSYLRQKHVPPEPEVVTPSSAVANVGATISANLIKKYSLNRDLCILFEVHNDEEMLKFLNEQPDRTDLQGIFIQGVKASYQRNPPDELSLAAIGEFSRLIYRNSSALEVFLFNRQRLDMPRANSLITSLCSLPNLRAADLYDCGINDEVALYIVTTIVHNSAAAQRHPQQTAPDGTAAPTRWMRLNLAENSISANGRDQIRKFVDGRGIYIEF